jgi:hypothetical protein
LDSSTGYLAFVGTQRDGVDRHHVRAVEEVGDAAEALGLALREEAAARLYRPDSWVFLSGAQVLRISSEKSASGSVSITSWPSSWRNDTDSPLTSTRSR